MPLIVFFFKKSMFGNNRAQCKKNKFVGNCNRNSILIRKIYQCIQNLSQFALEIYIRRNSFTMK